MCRVYGTQRNLSNRVYASEEAREEAFQKAEKLLSDLESEYPTFIKSMLQSHVSGGFWLVSGNVLGFLCQFIIYYFYILFLHLLFLLKSQIGRG